MLGLSLLIFDANQTSCMWNCCTLSSSLRAGVAHVDGLDWRRSYGERRGVERLALLGVFILIAIILDAHLFQLSLLFLLVNLCPC